MYFERWGLLAPPPEKATVTFPLDTLYHKKKRRASLACWRSGVQETVPRFDSTRRHSLDTIDNNTRFILNITTTLFTTNYKKETIIMNRTNNNPQELCA